MVKLRLLTLFCVIAAVRNLLVAGLLESEVAVISPYNGQVTIKFC